MVALLTETLDDAPWLARVKKVESETVAKTSLVGGRLQQ